MHSDYSSVVRLNIGILLLAELLACLSSNPLDDATIHSLIGFFTDGLADWKALRGALVGCLALLRRKSNAGVVTGNDARAVAESYLQNLQVQALGQHDRKLCYELLECLLDRYPNAVAELEREIPEDDPRLLFVARTYDNLHQRLGTGSGPGRM